MKAKASQPPLVAYYGDDFTGSTDVLESLSRAGLKTVLFLKPPTPAALAKFPGLRAFGIAGGSRAMSPRQMERALPPAFKALQASGARFIHYKTCSTFDSSPNVGSIGKAIELGRRVFGERITPLVVGVPVLGRYVVFGNLFACSGLDTEPSRLDRHPTMSRHPVTPMDEADIRLHLAKQTSLPVELVDALKLKKFSGGLRPRNRAGAPGTIHIQDLVKLSPRQIAPIVLFDTLDEVDLPVIGRLISGQAPARGQLFCAGSSGIEYALVAHWRQTGLLPVKEPEAPGQPEQKFKRGSRNQIVAVSGSCSPVTDRQIGRAVASGFVEISCDSGMLADEKRRDAGVKMAMLRAQEALEAGRHIIFHTARGAGDSRRAGFAASARAHAGRARAEKIANAGASLANGLAQILELALRRSGARRAVVCGGDTATHLARALGVEALEFVAPVAPGAPLCRVHAPDSSTNGCDLVFKGGQVGRDSFFPDFANKVSL